MATKLVNGKRVLVGSKADPESRKFLRESGGRSVQLADGTQLNALDSKNYGKTPTVISNSSILEKKIPQLNAKMRNLPVVSEQQTVEETKTPDQTDYNFDEILGLTKADKTQSAEQEDPLFNEQMALIGEMKSKSDSATREEISRIESMMKRAKAEQQGVDARGLSQVRNALSRAGGRYAPGSMVSAMTGVTRAGVQAIADLNMQEQELISQARTAQATNDYKLLSEKLNLIDEVRKEKSKTASELSATLQETNAQAQKDTAIAELVSQGVTDPAEMLKTLNANGGNFTFADITGALTSLTELSTNSKGDFSFETKQIGPLLGVGFTTEDIQDMQNDLNSGFTLSEVIGNVPPEMQDAVKKALGVDETAAVNMKPGVGATDNLGEQMIRTRLFPKAAAILNKGALSDADRAIIDERIAFFRDSGLSEQQILDVFSGWSQDVQSPYNTSFRDIIIANDKDGQGVSPALSRIGSLIASGNTKAAMRAVEETAMTKAKELDPQGYMSDATANTYTKRIDRVKKLLSEATDYGDTGFLEGNFNKVLGKLKGARAQEIRSELRQLYQQFRVENSGVAVTDSESKYLSDLFADIDDPKANFTTKLDVFQNGILDRYNSTRESVSLPKVRVLDILDPNERLNLYGNPTASFEESTQAGI